MYTKIYTHPDIATWFLVLIASLSEKDQMKVMNRIEHICDICRGKPVPPTAKPLHDVGWEDLCEIRVAIADNLLVRIHYFVNASSNDFVILNWYTKPDGVKDKNSYNKSNKKNLDQEIQWYIEEALRLKKVFTTNPEYYELLD